MISGAVLVCFRVVEMFFGQPRRSWSYKGKFVEGDRMTYGVHIGFPNVRCTGFIVETGMLGLIELCFHND